MNLEVFKSSYGYYNIRTIEGKPTEEMAEYLKTNGYRWSRNNNCWYPATAEAKKTNLHDDFVLKFQEKFFPADVEHVKIEKQDSQSLDERITYLENLITELQEAHKQDLEKIRILENLLTNHEETIVDYYTQQEQSQLDEEAEWEKENSLTTEEEKEIIENQKNNVNVTPEPTESLDSFFYDEMADDEDIYDERAQEDVDAEIVINSNELFEAADRIAREEEPEAEKVFSENISENREVEVTPDELSIAKAVLPTTQYVSTLRYSQGEEGNFFKQKIKDVAAAVSKAPKIGGTDGMEQHKIVLRYFHPTGTETLVTEIGKDGEAYGFQCLKGDYEMAEWGSIDLEEVKNIRGMEIDYHVPAGMTVERWLYQEHPEMYPEYAKFVESLEKIPFDIALETGNDVEAIANAMNEVNTVSLTTEQWRALDELAEAAKMDWWFEEYGSNGAIKKNVTKQDLDDLSTAFDGNLHISSENEKIAKELFKNNKIEFNDVEEESEPKYTYFVKDTAEYEQLTSKKDIKAIREQCREILKKPDSEITEEDKKILAQYEGAGGLNEENRTNSGILNEFYTPNNLVEKVWQIVDAYAPNAVSVLEPAAGVGKFANFRPNNTFTMHELDETSARINKILHPEANVIQGAYQKQFFDEGERFRNLAYEQPKYDVVIGNPPYGTYNDKYKGLGEGKEFDRYEEYFISKGLDALKDENSVMAFVVPSGFLNTASDKQKELIASKGKLIDAYRLPVGTFPTTEVGTDIIIMKPWTWDKSQAVSKEEMSKTYADELSNGDWFKKHPEKILGEVRIRSNRFGKEEEYVAVHEGLTIQDELNKIDELVKQSAPKFDVVNKKELVAAYNGITKALEEVYPNDPEKVTERTLEFSEAIKSMDFHKLGGFILWTTEKDEPVKQAAIKVFEEKTGKQIPVYENIDKYEAHHLTEIWLAHNTNTENDKIHNFTSEQDVVSYIVSYGTGTENGKERVNKFFAENSDKKERIKFLIDEYGWYGHHAGVFEMECKNNSSGIEIKAYINEPLFDLPQKLEKTVSWSTIHDEIERQRKAGIYLDKPHSENQKVDEKTNYVLDKLSKAGIEVVTGKEEFYRILESQTILQKMQENNSVEELFISKIEENLDSEIDKVTVNDVNLYNSYINISKSTPFVFKEFGLDEYPVNIYKQKLARALFLEKEKYGERLTHGHKGEFTDKEVKEVFKNIGNPRYIFNSKQDISNPENFYLIGVYDTFDKQGNPMMLSLHYNKNRKEVEANWVTAVYGKNANILVNDWTRKGYLVYKNDLEIEKAPEEVVALYMRVSNLHEAYKDNIKLKSDYVNNEGVFFFVQNNTTYGFTHDGKIYLNPDVMNSEAAVHEYTHLWDSYILKTNPDLWDRGLNIFKGTSLWDDVVNDENYADIKDDENLVLSECHARICGKIADAVLQKVLERDGDLKQAEMIDWDKECSQYLFNELKQNNEQLRKEDFFEAVNFISSPIKDLFVNERSLHIDEGKDSLIVAVHNHPSGNITASMEDMKVTETLEKSFSRSDGLCRFGGHIILDHDTFNLYTPYTKTLKETNGWVTIMDWDRFGKKDELVNENFKFSGQNVLSPENLFDVAKKINDTNSWNDDFIPVLFANASADICAVKLYDKSFFAKDPQFVRNQLQFSGIETGAIRAFPVVTEACMNKLSGLDSYLLEEKMKNLVEHSAFTDAVLPDSTIVEKYKVSPGINLFSPQDFKNQKPEVQTTWDRQIMNPTLFEQLQNGTLKIIVPEERENVREEKPRLKKAAGMDY